MSPFGRTLAVFMVVALLCATCGGEFHTAIKGQFGYGMAYLAAAIALFAVLLSLLKGTKRADSSSPPVADSAERTLSTKWTPDRITNLIKIIARSAELIWGRQMPPLLAKAEPKRIRSRRGGNSGVPQTVVPVHLKKFDLELRAIQKQLGLPPRTAQLMRSRVFAPAAASRIPVDAPRYPQSVDPRIVASRIFFARLIRPYVTARPSRGSDYCEMSAARIVQAVLESDPRRLLWQTKQSLIGEFSTDELLTFCLHGWAFSTLEIAQRLGISAFEAERSLRDIHETLAQIEILVRRRLDADGFTQKFSFASIFMLACGEWIPGLQAAEKEAS